MTVAAAIRRRESSKFHVEFWDRTPLKEQQTIFGRDKHTGAPLGMQNEHDVPRITVGILMAILSRWIAIFVWRTRAHRKTQSSLMMRRATVIRWVANAGQLDMGLLFVCYQHDLEKGFLTVQNALTAKRWRSTSKPSAAATSLFTGRYRQINTIGAISARSWTHPCPQGWAFLLFFPFFCISCLVFIYFFCNLFCRKVSHGCDKNYLLSVM